MARYSSKWLNAQIISEKKLNRGKQGAEGEGRRDQMGRKMETGRMPVLRHGKRIKPQIAQMNADSKSSITDGHGFF